MIANTFCIFYIYPLNLEKRRLGVPTSWLEFIWRDNKCRIGCSVRCQVVEPRKVDWAHRENLSPVWKTQSQLSRRMKWAPWVAGQHPCPWGCYHWDVEEITWGVLRLDNIWEWLTVHEPFENVLEPTYEMVFGIPYKHEWIFQTNRYVGNSPKSSSCLQKWDRWWHRRELPPGHTDVFAAPQSSRSRPSSLEGTPCFIPLSQ